MSPLLVFSVLDRRRMVEAMVAVGRIGLVGLIQRSHAGAQRNFSAPDWHIRGSSPFHPFIFTQISDTGSFHILKCPSFAQTLLVLGLKIGFPRKLGRHPHHRPLQFRTQLVAIQNSTASTGASPTSSPDVLLRCAVLIFSSAPAYKTQEKTFVMGARVTPICTPAVCEHQRIMSETRCVKR
jgi:hypothetical protein